jgi:ABC-2 type transport system ATP-binding protein
MTDAGDPLAVNTPVHRAGQSGACVAVIEDAVLTLGGHSVLNRAALRLYRGETYVLLGPNGAGKTSLIRVLCGHLPLDSGRVRLGDPLEDPYRNNRALRLIGYVPQSIAVFPRLTVRENLEVFSRFADAASICASIERLLEVTGLNATAGKTVAALSGGLQRRVNIAVALVARPELLLLDEPTVGLDLEARSAIHQMLGDLRNQGVTILLITHDFDQAERLADKVGFMNAGKIFLEGRPKEVLRQTFGAKQQVDAVLTDGIDDRRRAMLRAFGLEPVDGGLHWQGLTDEECDAPRLLELLRSTDIPLQEVRIREPGLDTLFRQAVKRLAS